MEPKKIIQVDFTRVISPEELAAEPERFTPLPPPSFCIPTAPHAIVLGPKGEQLIDGKKAFQAGREVARHLREGTPIAPKAKTDE